MSAISASSVIPPSSDNADPQARGSAWSYEQAFARNLGLISPQEQHRLRNARVAIAGMGGIGGIDAVTLARLGIGRFTIADPDTFEVANTNRQYGATASTVGRPKVEVMADVLRDINPEIDLRVFNEPIGEHNAAAFLHEADLFVDAIEVFAVDARRKLFQQAAAQSIHAITAGPVGFSSIWIVFAPGKMSFDRYFDLHDDMSATEQFAAFAIGVAPKATHRPYMDLSYVDIESGAAPSCALACQLAAGAVACEAMKILLKRGRLRVAPHYHQFDAYRGRFVHRRLFGGNRNPLQRLKRRLLVKALETSASTAD